MSKPQDKSENKIRCPHCCRSLTWETLLILGLDNDEVVDAAVPCPSCGKRITKKEMTRGSERTRTMLKFGQPNIPNIKEMQARRDVKGLLEALRYQKDEEVRVDAANALRLLGDSLAVESLIDALKDHSYRVRRAAAKALGEIGDARAVSALLSILRHHDFDTREGAAIALGNLRAQDAVSHLCALLESDDSHMVRRAAATALGLIGDKRAVEPLLRHLERRNRYYTDARRGIANQEFQAAARALGKIGDPQAMQTLIDMLGESAMQWAAVDALSDIGPPVVQTLHSLLNDTSSLRQRAERRALWGQYILEGRDEWDKRVHEVIREVLRRVSDNEAHSHQAD